MTRRNPTPPPPDDEPRYLTVVHPYPLNANLEVHADRRSLALWLACCTGKDVLLAMFHKPTSPGMVLIEVDRDFDSFHRLLGLHTWSEFLQKPNEEELEKVSKVFGCTYNTGRKVEKHGWKRVKIKEDWFHGWRRENDVIRHPYPKTSFCDVPSEAKTGAPMCLPLPQQIFFDQKDRLISWDAREDTDTQSVVTQSSARRTPNSVAGSDDEDDDYADEDDGLNIAWTDADTNTSGGGGGSRTGSSSDTRSTASSTPSVAESDNVWPSEPRLSSQPPSVSAAGGFDNGRRSGTRPATQSDGRSSVSSSSARWSTTASSGFPTFADTHWGDPITMAMADVAKEYTRARGRQEDDTGTGEEGPGPSGQEASRSAGRRKIKAKSAQVLAQAAEASALEEAVIDVQLPPGGPGSSWGDPNEPPW